MSHNLKENDEDISNLDVFDDNKDNIDKISKDEGSAVTDLESPEDNEKNGSGQKIVQEKSATEHKNVGGADVQGDEEQKGIEEGKDEEQELLSCTSQKIVRLLSSSISYRTNLTPRIIH
jgi:hypothetical protein